MKIEPKKYCVYKHFIDGKLFYIGKGIASRAFDTNSTSRNEIWKNEVDYGLLLTVEIVEWFEDSKEALKLEAELINEYLPKANIGIPKNNLEGSVEPFKVGEITLNINNRQSNWIIRKCYQEKSTPDSFIKDCIERSMDIDHSNKMALKDKLKQVAADFDMSVSELVKLGEE